MAWAWIFIQGPLNAIRYKALADPLIDQQGINWGLVQLSDEYEGEFTEEDEHQFVRFVHLISMHLETLWELRNLQKANAGKA